MTMYRRQHLMVAASVCAFLSSSFRPTPNLATFLTPRENSALS